MLAVFNSRTVGKQRVHCGQESEQSVALACQNWNTGNGLQRPRTKVGKNMKQQPGRKAAANDKMPGLSRSEVACSKRIRWASNAKPSEWETPAPQRAFVCSCLRVVSLVDFQQKSIQSEWKQLESKFLCCAYNIREVVSQLESISPSSRAEPVACHSESKLVCRVKTTGSSMSIILQCWNISKLERDHCSLYQ